MAQMEIKQRIEAELVSINIAWEIDIRPFCGVALLLHGKIAYQKLVGAKQLSRKYSAIHQTLTLRPTPA